MPSTRTSANLRKSTQQGNVKDQTKTKARSQRKKDAMEKKKKKKTLQREREKRYRESMKTSNTATEESSTSQEQPQFLNQMAKKRALDKVKKAMPSTPRRQIFC